MQHNNDDNCQCPVCRGLDSPEEIEAYTRQGLAAKEVSVFSVGVTGNRPNYAYTVGMQAKGLPELIVFVQGLDATMISDMLGNYVHHLEQSKTPIDFSQRDVAFLADQSDGPLPIERVFVDVEYVYREYASYLLASGALPDHVVQLVMPDRDGRLPGEGGFDRAEFTELRLPVMTATAVRAVN